VKFSPRHIKAQLVRIRLPFSSRRLLLTALFCLIGLMGITLTYTFQLLEALATETLNHSARSLSLADDMRSLRDLTVSMERSARQYGILDDLRLAEDFAVALKAGKQTAGRLRLALPSSDQPLTDRWAVLGDDAGDMLRRGPAAVVQQQSRMLTLFQEMADINQQLERGSRLAIQGAAQRFNRDMASYRQSLMAIGVWVAAVSMLAALILGLWLSWLFSELAAEIANLGEQKPPPTLLIGGPTDMHALALQIRAVKRTLESLEKDKELFMRHISHELKTPLANLREGVALLEDKVAGALTPEQERIVSILRANAFSLQDQIEDLLKYNAVVHSAARLDLRRTDILALIRVVIDEQRLRCEARRIRVEVTGSAKHAWLDPQKMRIILSNLLANAIHFSPEQGRIRFIIGGNDNRLTIDCADEGCGIDPDDRSRIFEPFYQGCRQVPAVKKGTGIGLSIVRQLVDSHQGKIALLQSDVGAHFRVELPLNQA
jgi:two-component system sensor histidine kinase GlrK